jgi:hypothetical protein
MTEHIKRPFIGVTNVATKTIQAPVEDGTHYVVDGEEYVRVTSVIDTVHGGPKSGMAYWGAGRFADYIEAVTEGTEFETTAEDIYQEFVASPFNPNTVKKAAGQRGDAAHKLFERLINGACSVDTKNGILWVVEHDAEGFPAFVPSSYDLGVVRAYLDIFQGIGDVHAEQQVYSDKYKFAGKSDVIRNPICADVKTHNPSTKKDKWAPGYWTDFLQEAAYALAWEEMTGEVLDEYMVILPAEDGSYATAHGYIRPETFLRTLEIYHEITEAA